MKKFTLTALIVFIVSFAASAQYDFAEWGIGGSYSRVHPYSDMRDNDTQSAYSLSLHWNYSPYVPFALEAQAGKLSGGNLITDPYNRFFVNNYLAFNLHGDLQLGEITNFENRGFLTAMKGFFVGTGVGAMFNNITAIQRYAVSDPTYMFPGKDHSVSVLVPIRFGYEFKVFNYENLPFMGVTLGYTYNLTFAEGLDGYNDPSSKFKNNAQDMFDGLYIGVKFNFGNLVQYGKPVR